MFRCSIEFKPGLENTIIFRAIKNIKYGYVITSILLNNFRSHKREDFEIKDVHGGIVGEKDTIDDNSIYYIKCCTLRGKSR